MKVTVNKEGIVQVKEVYNPIVLVTEAGEHLSIWMRDSGFEFEYQGNFYFAKEGFIEPFKRSARGNLLVTQRHEEEGYSVNTDKHHD